MVFFEGNINWRRELRPRVSASPQARACPKSRACPKFKMDLDGGSLAMAGVPQGRAWGSPTAGLPAELRACGAPGAEFPVPY